MPPALIHCSKVQARNSMKQIVHHLLHPGGVGLTAAAGMVRRGGAGGVRLTGVGVIAQQLGQHQAQWRRPGSEVRDDGVDHGRWSRPVAADRGGATSSFRRGGVEHWPRRRAMSVDERGSGDSDGGAPVMVTVNFDSLASYYMQSSTF
jgi:hypothetical protein